MTVCLSFLPAFCFLHYVSSNVSCLWTTQPWSQNIDIKNKVKSQGFRNPLNFSTARLQSGVTLRADFCLFVCLYILSVVSFRATSWSAGRFAAVWVRIRLFNNLCCSLWGVSLFLTSCRAEKMCNMSSTCGAHLTPRPVECWRWSDWVKREKSWVTKELLVNNYQSMQNCMKPKCYHAVWQDMIWYNSSG